MSKWPAVLQFGLNNIGKQFGLVGLGNLYAAFETPASSADPFKDLITYFTTIESQLNTLTTQVGNLESEVSQLASEVSGVELASYYTQIDSAYANIIYLSKIKPSKDLPLSQIQGTAQSVGNQLSNVVNGIYNICNELNTFLQTNASAGQGYIKQIGAINNQDKSLVPFGFSMQSICTLYMVAYAKAITCVQWLNALNKTNVIDFVLGDSWITAIAGFQSNLISAYNEQLPAKAQNLLTALTNLPTQTDSAGNATFLQGDYFPLWPNGIDVQISSSALSKYYFGMKESEFEDVEIFSPSCNSPGIFKLVPLTPLANASTSSDIHFALFYSSDPYTRSFATNAFVGNNGGFDLRNFSTTPGADVILDSGDLPPRFSLFLNPNGTFSIEWYSNNSSDGVSTGQKGCPAILQTGQDDVYYIDVAKDASSVDRTSQDQQFIFTQLSPQSSLEVVYNGATSQDLYTSSFDGKSWSGNTRVPSQSTGGYPASDDGVGAIDYKNNLLIAYKGYSTTNFYYGYFNGKDWFANSLIIAGKNSEKLTTSSRPALAQCAGLAYMVYKAATGNQLHFVQFDGLSWSGNTSLDNTLSDQPPALAADINLLYLALKGETSTNIYLNTYDTNSLKWEGLNKITSNSNNIETENAPAIAMFNNQLMLIFVASGSGELNFSVMDGSSWAKAQKISTKSNGTLSCSDAPSVSVYQGVLYLAYKGASDSNIYYTTYDGKTWSEAKKLKTKDGTPSTAIPPALTPVVYSYKEVS